VVMAIYFVLGVLLFGGLMACIAALSTTLRESQNFIVVITLPAMIPFFFLTIFAEEPNSTLAATLSMVPITAPLSMVMRTAVADVPLGEIALSIILLLLAVAFVIWLSGRFFRVNTLLMGKMPRLRDLPKLLRG
jgi:ABC-2 type transport system permease protein